MSDQTPNQTLQQTAAAMLVSESSWLTGAAAAAELWRSAAEGFRGVRGNGVSARHPDKVIDALYAGDVRAVERYLDAGGDINLVDAHGDTLLKLAATAGDLNMRMVRMLLKRGADATVRLREGGTLLHFACHLLRKDLALALLRAGCDPNAVNEAGETALSKVLWAFNPKKDLIKSLLEHGADPDAKHGGGESAIDIATRTGQIELFAPQ